MYTHIWILTTPLSGILYPSCVCALAPPWWHVLLYKEGRKGFLSSIGVITLYGITALFLSSVCLTQVVKPRENCAQELPAMPSLYALMVWTIYWYHAQYFYDKLKSTDLIIQRNLGNFASLKGFQILTSGFNRHAVSSQQFESLVSLDFRPMIFYYMISTFRKHDNIVCFILLRFFKIWSKNLQTFN